MAQLPSELTRMPFNSLDVLRYMGRAGIERADADTLAEGAGMSERGIGKAIRGLATKGYLSIDNNYIYYLTDKGLQAVAEIMEYDAANPQAQTAQSASQAIQQQIVIVAPDPMGARQTTTLLFGLEGVPPVQDHSQLILRLSSTSGTLSPAEVTLDLLPNQAVEPAETYYNPSGTSKAVRIRVEAMQLVNMMDVHSAGGLFFDVALQPESGSPQAWYGNVTLQA
jgi:hypothetical protein